MNEQTPPALDHACVSKALRDIQDEYRNRPLDVSAMDRLQALGGTVLRQNQIAGNCSEAACPVRFDTEGSRLYVTGDVTSDLARAAMQYGKTLTYTPGMLRRGVIDPSMSYDPEEFFRHALIRDGVESPSTAVET